MIELFDSHAHIQGHEFRDDIDAVIARAAAAGVRGALVPAVDLSSAEQAIVLTRRFPGLYASAGFHPHEASRFDQDGLQRLRELLALPEVIAVGECGLDYFRLHSSREQQLNTFSAMLTLASETGKPLIVHTRDAWEDMAAILKPWAAQSLVKTPDREPGVMHYFSGDVAQAEEYASLGFLISIHTSVTHPRAQLLREVVAVLPLSRLLIETDSPYGAPQQVRGQRNEPAFVKEAAATIASVKGLTIDEVAATTTANARRLFRIEAAASASLTGASV